MDVQLDGMQLDLLERLASPLTATELAADLGLSVSAVRRRIAELYAVLGASERAEAVSVAVALGLIAPPTPLRPRPDGGGAVRSAR